MLVQKSLDRSGESEACQNTDAGAWLDSSILSPVNCPPAGGANAVHVAWKHRRVRSYAPTSLLKHMSTMEIEG
jgi:hypothetical protein